MLPIFCIPSSLSDEEMNEHDLLVFNQWIIWITSQSSLPSKTREDAIKIIKSLQWLKLNMALGNIQEFINHKDIDIPQLNHIESPNVITWDHLHTSTDFNFYVNNELSLDYLSRMIGVFEKTMDELLRTCNLSALQAWLTRCHPQIKQDPIAIVLQFTEILQKTQIQLDDLLQLCQLMFFIEINNNLYPFVMVDTFFSPYYGQSILHEGGLIELNQTLVFTRMDELFSYPIPNKAAFLAEKRNKETNPLAWETAIFLTLIQSAATQFSESEMIQYRFNHEIEAKSLALWLKRCESLKNHQMKQCKVVTEDIVFVVQITPEQYHVLTGKDFQITTVAPQQAITTTLPESILNEWTSKNANGQTPLHIATRGKDPAAFQALINKAPQHAISAALTIKNNEGWTPLHMAAGYQGPAAFQALINKTSEDAISSALTIKNNEGWTPLHLAARYLDPAAFQALINKAPQHVISAALIIKKEDNRTPLHTAARYLDPAAFQALINKASQDAISSALTIKDNEGWSPLHTAASYQAPAAFQALINKASQDAISSALTINNNGWTPLHLAAHHQNPAAFQVLINKASQDAISTALIIKNNDGIGTPLFLAARYQDPAAFQALINKASQDAISAALTIKSNVNWTPLHITARCQEPAVFQALINKASQDAISAALTIKGKDGRTPLHLAARHQDNAAFQALINKAPKDAISAAITIKDNNDWTPLHLVARYQDPTAFQALINKASQDAISAALTIKNNNGWTPLHLVAGYQDHAAFQALLDNISPEAISAAATIVHAMILAKIDLSKTKEELTPWIHSLLKISDLDKTWPKETPVTDLPTLNNKLHHVRTYHIHSLIKKVITKLTVFEHDEANEPPCIRLADNTLLSVSHQDLISRVQTIGLASWKDLYVLKYVNDTTLHSDILHAICDNHLNAHLLINCSPQVAAIQQTCFEGHLLVKMFTGWQPNAWHEFLTQLQSPATRASLRKPLSAPTSHKYYHLAGEVRPYPGKQPRPKPHYATHAKKQSMTLLSPKLCTPLFQSKKENCVLVGIACCADSNLEEHVYHPEKAKIKAMLLSDGGTYARKWRGSKLDVQTYAITQRTMNYTAFDAFKTVIRDSSLLTNEILAEPSKGSLCAIVVGQDTSAARQRAYEYQQDVKTQLNIDLPIILYDAKKQMMVDINAYDAQKRKPKPFLNREDIYEQIYQQLTHYILRIELNKRINALPDFGSGFLFFKQSRQHNREANYLLAIYLREQILTDQCLPRTRADILRIRQTLITRHGIHIHPGYVERAIHSLELNQILTCILNYQAQLPDEQVPQQVLSMS